MIYELSNVSHVCTSSINLSLDDGSNFYLEEGDVVYLTTYGPLLRLEYSTKNIDVPSKYRSSLEKLFSQYKISLVESDDRLDIVNESPTTDLGNLQESSSLAPSLTVS